MKVNFFDGKKIASEKELELKKDVDNLRAKGVIPKMVSIVVGDEGGGRFYQNLKKKAAKRIGAEIEIRNFNKDTKLTQLIKLIKSLNADKSIHGVMVQLPLPDSLKPNIQDLIQAISPEKDVDGMGDYGLFLSPVAKAVIAAIKQAKNIVRQPLKEAPYKVVVIGARGFVGKKIVKALKEMRYKVEEVDIQGHGASLRHRPKDDQPLAEKTKKADILISATGKEGLIKRDMVKEGTIVIDVGVPKGDVQFNEVVKKASFITPVPGGIGPLTISCLLENLVEAVIQYPNTR